MIGHFENGRFIPDLTNVKQDEHEINLKVNIDKSEVYELIGQLTYCYDLLMQLKREMKEI